MELEINDIIAELGNSIPAITRKSIDINDPSARFIDFTNRFDLPDTNLNRQIFESPEGIGTNNRSFDKLYDVVLRDVFQIFRGKGFLDNSSKHTFRFQIVDESKQLFNALDIQLREINWDDKDTELSQAAIDSLDSADENTCWIWGKACYHQDALKINTDQTTGDARCKYSRPAFYVHGLLKRAIENNNYAFTLPNPDIAFSSNHRDFFFTSYQKTITDDFAPSGTLSLSGLNSNDFEHSDLTVTSTTIAIGTKKTAFRLRGNILSDAVITITIRATDDVDSSKISQSSFTLPLNEDTVDFTTSEFQSSNGMTVDIFFSGTGNVSFDNVLLYTILSEESEDLSGNPWLDYKIKAYDNLPEITYLDLYRLICILFNKYHVIDNYNKTFEFGSLSDLEKLNAVDWSDKFIINSEKITSKFSGLYQKNWLKYNNDLTVNPKLGWYYFNTDNESLLDEGDYLTLNFGASNDIKIDSNETAQVKIYNNTTRIPDRDINIRLFYIDSDKLIFSHLDWKNLSTNYYQTWFNSLYRIRYVPCEMNSSKLDVLKWHEKQLVYIDYFKSTFIVLEITNFIPSQRTKVTLLNYGR